MKAEPTAIEILSIVSEYHLDYVATCMAAPHSYYVRVAANSLDIVRREIEQGAVNSASERCRLAALLGEVGILDELNDALCDQIRSGSISIKAPELLAHLLQTSCDQVGVDQPAYASRLALLGRGPPSNAT